MLRMDNTARESVKREGSYKVSTIELKIKKNDYSKYEVF